MRWILVNSISGHCIGYILLNVRYYTYMYAFKIFSVIMYFEFITSYELYNIKRI